MPEMILAQAAGSESILGMILPFVLMIGLAWFLLIRPQQKQIREQNEFQSALKAGDEVVTAGGLYGRIHAVQGDVIMLEIASKTRIRVVRSQIVKHATELSDESSADNNVTSA